MSIEDGLYAFLSSRSTITPSVSNRIYPTVLPEKPVYPSIVYTTIGDDRQTTDTGQTNHVGHQFDIHCFDLTAEGAIAVRELVRAAIKNYSGLMGLVTVDKVFIYNPNNNYEYTVKAHRSTLSVTIFFIET